jgi:hypothetical protein
MGTSTFTTWIREHNKPVFKMVPFKNFMVMNKVQNMSKLLQAPKLFYIDSCIYLSHSELKSGDFLNDELRI